LCVLPNGSLAAFAGDEVMASAPYKPYAWYQGAKLPETVRGIIPMGGGLLVATSRGFYSVQGDPQALTAVKISGEQALIGGHMLTVGSDVLAPTHDGIVVVNGASTSLQASQALWEKADWYAFLATHFGEFKTVVYYDNKLIAFFANGGFIADMANGILTRHAAAGVTAARYVPETDELFMAIGTKLYKWNDATGTDNAVTYTSRVFRTPMPVNFGAAKVTCSGTGNFYLYCDGVLKHTEALTGTKTFRLPSGFKASEVYYKLVGAMTVTEVHIAETMSELRDA